MKLEIGGGNDFARGDGWTNMDQLPGADIQHDLNVRPWPLSDDSVDAIYTSHCIEHVQCPISFLHECARIGKVGCTVEIRCPSPYSDLAMVAGHVSVFSPQAARNMDVHFPRLFWKDKKRPRLVSWHFGANERLHEAKRELPFLKGLSDHLIMKYIPGCAHETVFQYVIQANEYAS
jgi:ubiquinone/menaquinone biosynthesis C-methylase UbiE